MAPPEPAPRRRAQPRIRVLCADPAWMPKDKLPGPTRGAERNYQCIPTQEICFMAARPRREYTGMSVPPLADDAILFLWRLASMPHDALQVAEAWGFRVVSEIVWLKRTKNGLPWFGMGRTVRGAHETALIAVRGRSSKIVRCRSIRSTFEAPVPVDPATGRYIHSAKPEIFYTDIVQRISAGPYCEMFARQRRRGWLSLGNQLPNI